MITEDILITNSIYTEIHTLIFIVCILMIFIVNILSEFSGGV